MLPNQVPSLIIPLESGNLLVPNSSVAEIVVYERQAQQEDSPAWVFGQIQWRNLTLPCISFDKIKNAIEGNPKIPHHIAIFNTMSDVLGVRFYGVAINGIPRLARVTVEDIVEEDGERHALEALRVQVNGEPCFIPNLEAIEIFLSAKNIA